MRRMAEQYEQVESRGWARWKLVLHWIAILLALFCVAGAINTAAGGAWALRISGARVDLPRHWDAVILMSMLAALLFGLGWLLGNLYVLRDLAKRHPTRAWAFTIAAAGMIAGVCVLIST